MTAKKRGRPIKGRSAKRASITMRMTNEMRAMLRSRATKAGRSVSEEAELILEKVIFPIQIEE